MCFKMHYLSERSSFHLNGERTLARRIAACVWWVTVRRKKNCTLGVTVNLVYLKCMGCPKSFFPLLCTVPKPIMCWPSFGSAGQWVRLPRPVSVAASQYHVHWLDPKGRWDTWQCLSKRKCRVPRKKEGKKGRKKHRLVYVRVAADGEQPPSCNLTYSVGSEESVCHIARLATHSYH